jgi:hypothetical protein
MGLIAKKISKFKEFCMETPGTVVIVARGGRRRSHQFGIGIAIEAQTRPQGSGHPSQSSQSSMRSPRQWQKVVFVFPLIPPALPVNGRGKGAGTAYASKG